MNEFKWDKKKASSANNTLTQMGFLRRIAGDEEVDFEEEEKEDTVEEEEEEEEDRVLVWDTETPPPLPTTKVTPDARQDGNSESGNKRSTSVMSTPPQNNKRSPSFMSTPPQNDKRQKRRDPREDYDFLKTPPYSRVKTVSETVRDGGVLVSREAVSVEDSARIKNTNIDLGCYLNYFIQRHEKLNAMIKKQYPGHSMEDETFIEAVYDLRDQVLAVKFRVDILSKEGLQYVFGAAQVPGVAEWLCKFIKNKSYVLKPNIYDDKNKKYDILTEWNEDDGGSGDIMFY